MPAGIKYAGIESVQPVLPSWYVLYMFRYRCANLRSASTVTHSQRPHLQPSHQPKKVSRGANGFRDSQRPRLRGISYARSESHCPEVLWQRLTLLTSHWRLQRLRHRPLACGLHQAATNLCQLKLQLSTLKAHPQNHLRPPPLPTRLLCRHQQTWRSAGTSPVPPHFRIRYHRDYVLARCRKPPVHGRAALAAPSLVPEEAGARSAHLAVAGARQSDSVRPPAHSDFAGALAGLLVSRRRVNRLPLPAGS